MKNAILIHGMPSKKEYFKPGNPPMSEKHWFSWLKKELTSNGIETVSLEMPTPYEPDYNKWREVFEKNIIGINTILVGHSCGGGFLVRWLSENKVKVGKVALVAPWIDPNDPRPKKGFFDFKIDDDLVSRTNEAMLFISADDDKAELGTAELLKQKLKGLYVTNFTDRGHFTLGDMGTEEFPELREFLLK